MPLRSIRGPQLLYVDATYAVPILGMATLGGLDGFLRVSGGSTWGAGTSFALQEALSGVRAMVKAGDVLFVAGPPDVFDAEDPLAAFEARAGAKLVAVSADDGKPLAQTPLESPPVFDGLIAAGGRLFASLRDGSVVCLAGKE